MCHFVLQAFFAIVFVHLTFGGKVHVLIYSFVFMCRAFVLGTTNGILTSNYFERKISNFLILSHDVLMF